MQINGNYINSVGSSDAASAGTSKLIEIRPTLRPAEVLEFVPGVIVSQHSGDGKANQPKASTTSTSTRSSRAACGSR